MKTKYKYSPSHEWIKIEANQGTVGITEYARGELGDTVYVELPPVGKKLVFGEEVVVLESTKAASDIYAPVSGEITEVADAEVLHKGIAARKFTRSFALGEYMEVSSASLKDGMLNINISRLVPEDKKPKIIKIK